MTTMPTKTSLSPQRRRLVELMQQVNFGRIEGLAIRDGEPVFDPPPQVIREVKFGRENGPRRELKTDDFVLKSQVVDLFKQLDQLGTGLVETLEIQHGRPFRMSVVEAVQT